MLILAPLTSLAQTRCRTVYTFERLGDPTTRRRVASDPYSAEREISYERASPHAYIINGAICHGLPTPARRCVVDTVSQKLGAEPIEWT